MLKKINYRVYYYTLIGIKLYMFPFINIMRATVFYLLKETPRHLH